MKKEIDCQIFNFLSIQEARLEEGERVNIGKCPFAKIEVAKLDNFIGGGLLLLLAGGTV